MTDPVTHNNANSAPFPRIRLFEKYLTVCLRKTLLIGTSREHIMSVNFESAMTVYIHHRQSLGDDGEWESSYIGQQ